MTAKYAATWANPVLFAVKALLSYAWERGDLQSPYRVGVLKSLPLGKLKRKGIPVEKLVPLLRAVAELHPRLARLMLAQVYMLGRPGEVSLAHHRKGQEVGPGLYAVHGKTSNRTGEDRILCIFPRMSGLSLESVPTESDPTQGRQCKFAPNGTAYQKLCWRIGRRLREKHGDGFIKSLAGTPELSPHFLRHTESSSAWMLRFPKTL